MSVNLFRIGRVWHFRYTVDGKRVQRSSRSTQYARAEKVAQAAYREASLWARNGRVIPTLRELVSQWLQAHDNVVSRSHISGVETFGRLHLYGLGDTLIDELTTASVEQARNQHLETHAATTANHWCRTIRLLCNWAVHREVIPAVPFKVRMIKVQKKARATLPHDLTAQWLKAIDETAPPGIQLAVRLMLGMGLRESEAASARWENCDWLRMSYTPPKTKGREADPVPMPIWLCDYLRPLRKITGPMIVKPDGRQYGRGFTRASIHAATQHVGIDRITPHRLRASFATSLSYAGVPVQAIQRAMRHKNVATTVNYLEVDMNSVAIAQQRIAEQCGLGT
ncbi:integrase [Burkholderia sp. PAMC 28687]|uniref:tyrosine-type recombinase/integrase n=1 Tax=Burkholderia sp. PAMC 28687 TaxID=1795874 RepID=UPI000784CC21|nr:tyrosine-type recombinase/integrase [Burkholderia sp. PAMC 28687]AMM13334.1 integrase [Burkholderia sp. PAMC 28687]